MATFFAIELNEGAYWAATMRVARADTGAATGVLNTGGNFAGIVSAPIVGALSGAGTLECNVRDRRGFRAGRRGVLARDRPGPPRRRQSRRAQNRVRQPLARFDPLASTVSRKRSSTAHIYRLGEMLVEARLLGASLVRFLTQPGKRHQHRRLRAVLPSNFLRDRVAIRPGHADVEQAPRLA